MRVILAIAALEGFGLGYFLLHWFAILSSGMVFGLGATLIAAAEGFSISSVVAIGIGCLVLNELAYLPGLVLRVGRDTNRSCM